MFKNKGSTLDDLLSIYNPGVTARLGENTATVARAAATAAVDSTPSAVPTIDELRKTAAT